MVEKIHYVFFIKISMVNNSVKKGTCKICPCDVKRLNRQKVSNLKGHISRSVGFRGLFFYEN